MLYSSFLNLLQSTTTEMILFLFPTHRHAFLHTHTHIHTHTHTPLASLGILFYTQNSL